MLTTQSALLITGATGFIGGEILKRLLEERVATIWALVRPGHEGDPRRRLLERLGRSGMSSETLPPAVQALPGDVLQPDLGMSPERMAELGSRLDIIVHCASETSFIRAQSCRKTNVEGMRHVIGFAKTCARRPTIVYVGSASSCGDVRGRCLSETDRADATHCNEYTRTKAEAEQMLAASGLPYLVIRPSIVLAEGTGDKVFAMGLLWCLPLAHTLGGVPVSPTARVDLVSVRYVVESLIRLLQLRARTHDCYYISAGPTGAITNREVAEKVAVFYGSRASLELIPPDEWTDTCHRRYVHDRRARMLFSRLRPYFAFLNMDTVFDNHRLHDELAGTVPDNPPVTTYIDSLLARFSLEDALRMSIDP